jgi:tRNA (mo5U34)-methyltransferase
MNGAARVAEIAAARLRRAAASPSLRSSRLRARSASTAAQSPHDVVWFHSIDLGNGEVTPGMKSADQLAAETTSICVPANLEGQTALDIGAWDGYFSFELERRNASRVVALDHYAWSLDLHAQHEYHAQMKLRGQQPRPAEEVPGVWDPVGLPGRAGFDYARGRLASRVEPVVGDFMTMDLAKLGRFDIVLFLGVLYHLKDPFLALRRLRETTRDLAIIETATVVLPAWADEKLFLFLETTELDDDAGNWWAPTPAGLTALCRAAGFRDVHVVYEPIEYDPPNDGYTLHFGRTCIHARV